MHFDLKLQELQNNLDMWRARDNTLFEAVLIIRSLGLSQLDNSASNRNVPEGIVKLCNFLWKNKNQKSKIKRAGLYQDWDNSSIRMTDIETMIKALRLASITRLLIPEIRNWKTIQD